MYTAATELLINSPNCSNSTSYTSSSARLIEGGDNERKVIDPEHLATPQSPGDSVWVTDQQMPGTAVQLLSPMARLYENQN